ncbi:MAG TPA: hypothetical protein VLY20_03055 [Nitrospiria bacterium]|nr:hypothetical protein [Nitrospiria bacterium]HUK55617.1 hypothetical protein [Nitrospiria bacterium]
MWRLFKKRQKDDLSRLVSAYRFLLKISRQNTSEALQPWRGAFGQACQLLFRDWPSPNESRRFEKKMLRRLQKTVDVPRAFILAFNDYLDQKPLSPEELDEVIRRGREVFG